jgi:AcrR family transcriptional regulator
MTLYKHFKSKDALILAVLELRDQRFRQWMEERTFSLADHPKGRLLAVFDALEEWFADPKFHGCLFINAAAEYGLPTDEIHQSAAHHKRLVLDWLIALAAQTGIPDPESLAAKLMLIMEGAIVTRQAADDPNAARTAKELARLVVTS